MEYDEHTEYYRHAVPRGYNWVFIAFLAIAAFFLFAEHRAHMLGALPFLLLLACPLMHMFMHHGHGDHGTHGSHDENSKRSEK